MINRSFQGSDRLAKLGIRDGTAVNVVWIHNIRQ
jgi:hypothetical protein